MSLIDGLTFFDVSVSEVHRPVLSTPENRINMVRSYHITSFLLCSIQVAELVQVELVEGAGRDKVVVWGHSYIDNYRVSQKNRNYFSGVILGP